MANKTDLKFMKETLRLAKLGKASVCPNPMVGCVIVKNGKTIAKGYHKYFGGSHAEVNALNAAGKLSKGATLYVNLEPCSHYGKTPPCTEAIIKAGIVRVVAAIADPNPKNSGNGFRILKRNGISVTTGVLAKQARALNNQFCKIIRSKNTHVLLKIAMSFDGKIAAKTGDSRWVTSKPARKYVHKLRSEYDAIVVGIGTVLKDNPRLTSHGAGKNPIRIVIDPDLQTPIYSNMLDGVVPTVFLCTKQTFTKMERYFVKENVFIKSIESKNNQLPFKNIIKTLNDMGLFKILIEGGGNTAAKALEDQIVDEVMFFIAPKIIGGKDAPTPVEGLGVSKVADAIMLSKPKVLKFGNDIALRAFVKKR